MANGVNRAYRGKTFFDTSGYRVGAQGIGSTATGYQAPPGLPTVPLPADVRAANRAAYYARNITPESTPAALSRDVAAQTQGGVVPAWNRGDPRYDPAAKAAQDAAAAKAAVTASGTVDVGAIRGQSAAARQALADQRAGLENVRGQLINRLGVMQTSRRGGSRMVTDPRVAAQISGIDANLRNIGRQESQLQQQENQDVARAFRQADMATAASKAKLHQDTANDVTGVMQAINNIQSKPGTPEFHQELAAAKKQFPLYAASPSGLAHVDAVEGFHNKQVAKELQDTTKGLQRYNITPDEFARISPGNVMAGKIVDSTGADIDPNAPKLPGGSKFTNQYTGAETGPITAVNTGTRQVLMPTDEYNRYRGAFGAPPDQVAIESQPTPAEAQPTTTTAPQSVGTINGLPAQQAIDEARARNQGQFIPTGPAPSSGAPVTQVQAPAFPPGYSQQTDQTAPSIPQTAPPETQQTQQTAPATPAPGTQTPTIPVTAIDHLKANPDLAPQFEDKYKVSADSFLNQ